LQVNDIEGAIRLVHYYCPGGRRSCQEFRMSNTDRPSVGYVNVEWTKRARVV